MACRSGYAAVVTALLAAGADINQNDNYVKVSFSDTGIGMEDEVAAKIFEPFYTTKEVGKGTGLGLSQLYGFVKESNGFVEVHSKKGKGTNISIFLPHA